MATNNQSAEQRELALVGKVELRIALTDSDAKLETTLKTYLAPLLLKLASEHQSVRNKVMTICQHVNTRVKPDSVQLPVAALMKQFKEQQSSLIRHFDLLYIQQGVERLSAPERATLLPVIINGIADSDTHGATIFNLLLRLLETFRLPPRGDREDVELRSKYEVRDEDAAYLAKWIGKVILFAPVKPPMQSCPGLTPEEYMFITAQSKPDVFNPAQGGLNLPRTKVLAARLMASGFFHDHERFLPALYASADSSSLISVVGEDMMKRTLPMTDLEDETLLQQLFMLYFGDGDARRVRPPLRIKILGLLGRSQHSTSFSTKIMTLVEDGVAPPDAGGEDSVMSGVAAENRTSLGREASKLRSAVFAYVNYVARSGAQETLHSIAPRVVGRLRDFIENQGWPKVGQNEDLVSRGYAYEVIGLLAKAGPRDLLIESDQTGLDLLRWLLNSLAQDTAGNAITVSIEESLSTLITAIARFDLAAHEREILEELLVEQMMLSADLEANKRLRSTRYVAVRFANRCLPFDSVKARWIDVLGIGARDDRAEVREESERGLNPYWYQMLRGTSATGAEEILFASFEDVVRQFFGGRTVRSKVEPMAVVVEARKAHKHCFVHMVAFARRVLFHEALMEANMSPGLDNEWDRRIDAAAETDPKARSALKQYISGVHHKSPQCLAVVQSALFESLTADPSAGQVRLIEFLSLVPDASIARLTPYVGGLLPVILSNHHTPRLTAAQAFGIVATHAEVNESDVRSSTEDMSLRIHSWKTAAGALANQIHGAVVALGYFHSRSYYRGRSTSDAKAFTQTLLEILKGSKDALLREATFIALGQLCMFRTVQLTSAEVKHAAEQIYDIAKTGNEQAILCLGQLSMIVDEEESTESAANTKVIEEHLHKLHEVRQAEVHFSVGEAYSCLAIGWQSDALATKLDIDGPLPTLPARSGTLGQITDRFITDSTNTKPSLKKAAAIWLLCMIQFCGEQKEVQSRLGKIQQAFKRCLSDRDELVQETASRGLGLVYEKGDRNLKDDLVRDLVSSFSSDKQTGLAGAMSEDTQLFEPGALPTGEGSVSTYKDIMSLASEVGDSSLVYRFMSMASSNAIWSSRAAFGRFGLSNVLSDSSVDGYLAHNPKLYPKLYRYRFDPNSGVQRSMNDIWVALVKDSSATLDKHFDAIIEDLLTNVLGKEWRTRQASCAAIADLVQGRVLEKYEPYLERIWTCCFKVLDDIKESVRAAAALLARTLTGILTRSLEADHSSTKTASAMLKHVLPFLLSPSGMESSAQDVQLFAVVILLEIVKKANGQTLRPFIPELVERLIGLLSSLENEAVNYIHLNADKYNLTEEKIDNMRLSNVRGSPIMESIERCLDLLDDETMIVLRPRLENAMRTVVGLPSKVGASRVLVSLSTRRMPVFKPVADDFLKLLEKLVIDRNETVSSSYAVAAGYVARGTSDKAILRLVTFAKKMYFESDGDREAVTPRKSVTAGELMFALAKHSSDRFNNLASSILPFIFVAKHDSNKTVKEQFHNTWEEAVAGSRAVLLYLHEILTLADTHLDSAQWVLKQTAARTVADAVMSIAASDNGISPDTAKVLWPSLEKALGGKTWEGKEVVLGAFVKFVQTAKTWYLKEATVADAITKIAVREAKRQNVAYRPHALQTVAQVSDARDDVEISKTVLEIVTSLFDAELQGDKMDVDEDAAKASKDNEIRDNTLAAAVEAVFSSIKPDLFKPDNVRIAMLAALTQTDRLSHPGVVIRKALYTSLAKLFAGLSAEKSNPAAEDSEIVAAVKHLLFRAEGGSEALRLLRADAIIAAGKFSSRLVAAVRTQISDEAAAEASPTVRDRLRLALG
ncbi:hypothetical protein B0A48_05905 [Cryoendolithus antarcticus]|uniref:ARM repeat-containing protein n=1 Tax=Cryoendolithus antarcticus TaxID=1507870 RepID=A0A1V8TCK2_9PEZI|nr:hypothetical protein B0A48_05905 [Cryoendolithus antarcticus]